MIISKFLRKTVTIQIRRSQSHGNTKHSWICVCLTIINTIVCRHAYIKGICYWHRLLEEDLIYWNYRRMYQCVPMSFPLNLNSFIIENLHAACCVQNIEALLCQNCQTTIRGLVSPQVLIPIFKRRLSNLYWIRIGITDTNVWRSICDNRSSNTSNLEWCCCIIIFGQFKRA